MKKNQTVQGTFSKLFGKKHANPAATSLYATNPPWIFTQEAREEGTRDFDGIYYGDNRFHTVSESGTATLKARPRVRPLLTFLPLYPPGTFQGRGDKMRPGSNDKYLCPLPWSSLTPFELEVART